MNSSINRICLVVVSSLIPAFSTLAFAQKGPAPVLPPVTAFEQIVVPTNANLYQLSARETVNRTLDVETIAAQNQRVFDGLALFKPRTLPKRKDGVSMTEALEVLNDAATSEVVGYAQHAKYDPKQNIGFCFGRAMFIHLDLLTRKVNKSSVYKAFIVGSMKSGGITWGFHVATVVRSDDGQFYAIDPNFGWIMTVREWFDYYAAMDVDKKLRIFIAPASKFGPSARKYTPFDMKDKFYNKYFEDMLQYYRLAALKRLAEEGKFPEVGAPKGAR